MTPRLPGWRTLWFSKRELFVSPKGYAYVQVEKGPAWRVELFLKGRFVRLKRYDLVRFAALEKSRKTAAQSRRRGRKHEEGS